MQKRPPTLRLALRLACVFAWLLALLPATADAAAAVALTKKLPPVRRADPTDPLEYLLPSDREKTQYATRIAKCLAKVITRTGPYKCNYLWPKAMEMCLDWSYIDGNSVIDQEDYLHMFTFGPYMECLGQKAARQPAKWAVIELMTRIDYAAYNRWGDGKKVFSELSPICPRGLWPGGTALAFWHAKRACAPALPESVVEQPPSKRRGWRRLLPARWWPLRDKSSSSSSRTKFVTGASSLLPSSSSSDPSGASVGDELMSPIPHSKSLLAHWRDKQAWTSYFSRAKNAASVAPGFTPNNKPVRRGR